MTTPAPPPVHRHVPVGWAAASVGVLAAALLVGVSVGPSAVGLADVLAAVRGEELTGTTRTILLQLRIPRVVLGALVGGTLATAGAAYQGVFRNPLADPYFLGVAAGAGLGATVALATGVAGPGNAALPLLAFVGASLAVAATWVLGRSAGGRATGSIILAGVAVSLFLSAAQTYLQQRNIESLRQVYGFLLGQLSTAGWGEVATAAPWALVAVAGLVASRRLLDVLAVGDVEATSLGLRADRVRLVVLALATLGTAAVVAVSGLIGFVGIVVPHTVRLVVGGSYRVLVPLSFVLGAAFLVLADVLARTLLAPAELPIGVVTAFVGGPFFLLVLRTSRRALL